MEKQTSKFKSPFKSNKYKSIFAFLSPSNSKRSVKLKDRTKSQSLQSIEDEKSYRKHPTVNALHYSSESIYSEIVSHGDSSVPKHQKTESNLSNQSEKFPSSVESIVEEIDVSGKCDVKEPIYATVHKKSIPHVLQPQDFEIKDLKENNKILKEKIKDLSEDNRLLKKKLQDFIKEEKWKEERLHSNLQLRITELEAETRKEVSSLTDHMQILMREKHILNEQIDVLQTEKKSLQVKHEELYKKLKTMVPFEVHKKTILDNQRLINEVEKRYTTEENKLRELCKVLEESKNSLEQHAIEIQSKVVALETKTEQLDKINKELTEDKRNLLEQAEESKQMEQDMQTMLLSLLKVTETMAMERNVLMRKASFQDHQQKEVQSTVIDYSLNVGRLQEHILNLYKENHGELTALRTNKNHHDENLKHIYGKQFDILRDKIVTQNNRIHELENENRKLESQLELIWQAACGKNSKLLEDVKAILQSHTFKGKT